MFDALEKHFGKVSIYGRNITSLRFADDTDAFAEKWQELETLVESLEKTYSRYKLVISAEKNKPLTNSDDIKKEILVKRTEAGHCNKLQIPLRSYLR